MSAPTSPVKGASPKTAAAPSAQATIYARRHLLVGWLAVLIFLTLGFALELLHGLKVGWYLSVANSTRRFMFTLAHAHGTLLGLLNIAFALSLSHLPDWQSSHRAWAASCLLAATVLIPGGFFLGGVVIYAGDPGVGIVLVPVGALLLFVAVFLTVRAASKTKAT